MGIFFLQTASVIFLLIVASGVTYAAKIFRFPATVLLVAMGICIGFLASHNILPFMDDFELSSDVLFYVLLPILLFESAYNIRYTDLLKNIYAITTLSLVSLCISAFVIAILLYYVLAFIGLPIPFIITLLFGALISATDTAAALSIFKNVGVPKRLNVIFEGESLFNDGTAIAFFIVVLSIVESQATSGVGINHMNLYEHFIEGFSVSLGSLYPLINGFISLGSMIGFGILIGGSIGIIFSKIIQRIQNETYLEITLSLALAHATFLLAEFVNHFFVPVSGIIATVAAAMILGNYGRYKISPKVEEVMEKYWGFFTFLSNNLVFILVGMLLIKLDVNWKPVILPIFCTIPIVVLARFISVYPVFYFLNLLKKEENVPASWQLVLSLGALRGGIAVMLVLLIPEKIVIPGWEYSLAIRDILLSLTLGVVMFSIFINTLTLAPLIKKLGIDTLTELETLQYLKAKMYLFHSSLAKIMQIREGRYIDAEEGQMLIDQYKEVILNTEKDIDQYQKNHEKDFSHLIKQVFALHALAIEEQSLLRLYKKNEVNESVFKKIIERIRLQMDAIEKGQKKIQGTKYIKVKRRKLERLSSYILTYIEKEIPAIFEKYYEVRTLHIITEKALESLKNLREVKFLSHYKELQEVIDDYESFDADAENTRRQLFKAHRNTLRKLSGELTKKSLLAEEEENIETLGTSNIIGEKIVSKLEKELHGKL